MDRDLPCQPSRAPEETTPPTYLCLSPEGEVLRRVTLPEGLIRTGFPRQDPGVEIGADHLLGAWRDGTGVSVVRLYRLEAADPSLGPAAP